MDIHGPEKVETTVRNNMGESMIPRIACLSCFQPATALSQVDKVDDEGLGPQYSASVKNKLRHGGWKTIPFIIGNELCAGAAITGLAANMIVYLTTQFNIKNIDATHIINISNGGNDLSPLIGAFLSDAYLGRFWAVCIGSLLSLSAMVTLMLTAIINPLRPPPCTPQLQATENCHGPSKAQFAVLCLYFVLTIAGSACIRYNSSAFGADQFDKGTAKGMKQIQRFFNWYYLVLYISIVIASTVIVYIQASVSWAWGFGVCVVMSGIAIVFFLSGTKFYNRFVPEGSPFTVLAQVIVAALRKRHLQLPSNSEEFFDVPDEGASLTQQLRFLNKAAIKTSQDFYQEGSTSHRTWRLCSVQQVEDLKSILETLPIWSSGIVPAIIYSQQNTFSVLQALTMDRHLGPHFQIPAASFVVFNLLASAISLAIYDKLIVPLADRMGKKLTQLQRIGVGMVISTLGMGVAAIVEKKRLKAVQAESLSENSTSVIAMSALWLVPQHVIIGFGEAIQMVGKIDFFYSEFPETMRSTATALVGAGLSAGSYVSSLLVSVVHRKSDWLTNNLNMGRLDYFYALLCVMGVLNFAYFTACARWYKYKAKSAS